MFSLNINTAIIISGILFTIIYCEFLIYYVVIAQCGWIPVKNSLKGPEVLKALLLTDMHLPGPRHCLWIEKWRRNSQMHRAFKTIITLHEPDVVFVLGDLFDEGEYSSNDQFEEYVEQFHQTFSLPPSIPLYVMAGNHDIGFHNNILPGSAERFSKHLNSSSVQFVTLKNNHFVLINSMALEGDSCQLCTDARNRINNISEILKCSANRNECKNNDVKLNYSRPMLLQHFPLYRLSEAVCTEPDSAPLSEKYTPFRLKIDALAKEATDDIVFKLKPRAAFGGHTHYGCLLHHSYTDGDENVDFYEYSLPSFTLMYVDEPKYMMVTMTPEAYEVNKCSVPKQSTIIITAIIFVALTFCIAYEKTILFRRRNKKYSLV